MDICEQCEWSRLGLRMLCPDRKSVGSGCDGGFAEYVVIPAKHVFHLPEGISLTLAALCEPLACVVRIACERTNIHAGDYVLASRFPSIWIRLPADHYQGRFQGVADAESGGL